MTAGSSRPLALTAISFGLTDLQPSAGGSSHAVMTLPGTVKYLLAPAATGLSAPSLTPANTLKPPANTLHRRHGFASDPAAAHPAIGKPSLPTPGLRTRRIESNRGLCRG